MEDLGRRGGFGSVNNADVGTKSAARRRVTKEGGGSADHEA